MATDADTAPTPMSPPWTGLFLARRAIWDWHNPEQIRLVSPVGGAPRLLDRWQTIVFHGADGNTTLDSVVSWLPSQYADKAAVPVDFREELRKACRVLIDELHAVALWPAAKNLTYKYLIAISEQNPKDRDEWDALASDPDAG